MLKIQDGYIDQPIRQPSPDFILVSSSGDVVVLKSGKGMNGVEDRTQGDEGLDKTRALPDPEFTDLNGAQEQAGHERIHRGDGQYGMCESFEETID